jgi:hypothetical protein
VTITDSGDTALAAEMALLKRFLSRFEERDGRAVRIASDLFIVLLGVAPVTHSRPRSSSNGDRGHEGHIESTERRP